MARVRVRVPDPLAIPHSRVTPHPTLQPGAPLKLIDFGLAIHLNKNENATEVCGTTSYMAPEVLHGNYSMECDVRRAPHRSALKWGNPPLSVSTYSRLTRALAVLRLLPSSRLRRSPMATP